MAAQWEFTCSLRFFGEDLAPEEITRMLGCEPTNQHRKGEIQTFKSGRTRTYKTGRWSLDTRDEFIGPDEQVADILGRISDDLSVWAALSRFSVDLYCGVALDRYKPHALILSPATQKSLGERGIELDIQIYPPSDDETRLDRLQLLGGDITQQQTISFWMHFPEKGDSEHAADLLSRDGFEPQMRVSPTQPGFLLSFTTSMTPSPEALDKIGSDLWDLCSGRDWDHHPMGHYIG